MKPIKDWLPLNLKFDMWLKMRFENYIERYNKVFNTNFTKTHFYESAVRYYLDAQEPLLAEVEKEIEEKAIKINDSKNDWFFKM